MFELVIGVFIVLLIATAGKEMGNKLILSKMYTSRDLALLVDGLHLVPGNAVAFYEAETERFTVTFKDNAVDVSSGVPDFGYSSFRYVDGTRPLSIRMDRPPFIAFSKKGTGLEVARQRIAVSSARTCTGFDDTRALSSVSVRIHPDFVDRVTTRTGDVLADPLHKVAFDTLRQLSLEAGDPRSVAGLVEITRSKGAAISQAAFQEAAEHDDDVFIWLSANDELSWTGTRLYPYELLEIYVAASDRLDEAKSLTCHIVNGIVAEFPELHDVIVHTPLAATSSADEREHGHFSFLGGAKDKIGLHIRISNLHENARKSMLTESLKTARGIRNGMANYHRGAEIA